MIVFLEKKSEVTIFMKAIEITLKILHCFNNSGRNKPFKSCNTKEGSIFNQTGNKLFERINPSEGWNEKYSFTFNGNKVGIEVYFNSK
jgi:hypothetical protein